MYNLSSNPWNSYSNHTHTPSMSPPFHHSPTPRLPTIAHSIMPNSGYTTSTHPRQTFNPSSARLTKISDRITFKNSPFYTVQRPLTNVAELKAREQTRDTVRLEVKLDETLAQRFQSEPSCRALVFCAAEPPDSAWKPVDITFPHHAELKCNQEELKVNLKGLKNRPGSTRPVDITHLLRKKAGFPNTVEMVYALTSKVSSSCCMPNTPPPPPCCVRSHEFVLCTYRLFHQHRNSFLSSILFRKMRSTRLLIT